MAGCCESGDEPSSGSIIWGKLVDRLSNCQLLEHCAPLLSSVSETADSSQRLRYKLHSRGIAVRFSTGTRKLSSERPDRLVKRGRYRG